MNSCDYFAGGLFVIWAVADTQVFLSDAIKQAVKVLATAGPGDLAAQGARYLLTHSSSP